MQCALQRIRLPAIEKGQKKPIGITSFPFDYNMVRRKGQEKRK
nr:MAG TPA: hypothetical protein [Caudoviricetes sp.]